jgi:hypothetical protein
MKHKTLTFVAIVSAAACCSFAAAQAPSVSIDPQRHGNLAAAQESIVVAYIRIGDAQQGNDSHLGGHAAKAKDLLNQANEELRLAADFADQNQQSPPSSGPPSAAPPPPAPPPPAPPPPAQQTTPDLSGTWTIYAYNVSRPGSSLKTIQIVQQGNIISGSFHGPNQHGKLQGLITGNHVEFSTDTHEVLTFRGEITPTGMSGLYGVNGQHAPWTAERTN